MAIKIETIINKSVWENFVGQRAPRTFLQSWEWGEFQKKMGNKIWRLGIFNDNKLSGTALISKISAKRGTFLLIQHGPCLADEAREEIFAVLLTELKKIGDEEKAGFIRINPLWERGQKNKIFLKNFGFREAPMHANAYEATWKLDIAAPEEKLLANMRKTTRYLIRQALKNQDIAIEKSDNPDSLEEYQKLNQAVAKKQSFTAFSPEYIKNEFKIFAKEGQILCFFGKYKGEPAAAALIIFWQGTAYYHQAASGFKHAKFSLPYLIAWEAIKEAKKRGCAIYDFWGYTDPQAEPKHPWAGPTLFKMGFGGSAYKYIKTQDLPLNKKYWLNYTIEKIRKIRRGY
ncbi:MAG: peptidoglycan bridge formation glycyltransferase FemA/FemB family protein [Patescibacteria group bacterium]|nr:peptidoglycan bridge formation glycyltransferase FemA/FemB family protein [Patescibacteria group bacterium]